MDVSGGTPYLPVEMIRRLLTLFAILTGLTALGAPAQARISAMDEVRVHATGDVAEICSPVRAMARTVGSAPAAILRQNGPRPLSRMAVITPAVMLKADRARE